MTDILMHIILYCFVALNSTCISKYKNTAFSVSEQVILKNTNKSLTEKYLCNIICTKGPGASGHKV